MRLKIFSTFLLAALLSEAAGGSFSTTGEAPPGVPERFGETARRLLKIFRASWRNSRGGLTIAFSPAVPEESAELQCRAATPVLILNGAPDLRRGADWRRKFYGAVLLAAADARLRSGECRALPPWLPPALDRMLEARDGEEQLLHGNRRSPVLGALLENGRLPAAAAVRAVDPEHFDPATLAWTRELARALFVSGGRRLASPGYLRNCGAAKLKGSDPDLWWMPDPEPFERNYRRAARQLAWHELAPRPARWTRKKLAELRKLRLPVLDEQGKPTEKFEEFDVLELPQRLRNRPDAVQRAAEFHRRFFEFSAGESRELRLAITAFADLAGGCADPRFRHETRMRRQLEEIDKLLARREKLDGYMKNEDRRRAPVLRAYRVRLECIAFLNSVPPPLSGAARAWVDAREAEFR